jgi:hypothetical protein
MEHYVAAEKLLAHQPVSQIRALDAIAEALLGLLAVSMDRLVGDVEEERSMTHAPSAEALAHSTGWAVGAGPGRKAGAS